jgi:hypothetical protein
MKNLLIKIKDYILYIQVSIYIDCVFAIDNFDFNKDPTGGKDIGYTLDNGYDVMGKAATFILAVFGVAGIALVGTSLLNLYKAHNGDTRKSMAASITGVICGALLIAIPTIMFLTRNTITNSK